MLRPLCVCWAYAAGTDAHAEYTRKELVRMLSIRIRNWCVCSAYFKNQENPSDLISHTQAPLSFMRYGLIFNIYFSFQWVLYLSGIGASIALVAFLGKQKEQSKGSWYYLFPEKITQKIENMDPSYAMSGSEADTDSFESLTEDLHWPWSMPCVRRQNIYIYFFYKLLFDFIWVFLTHGRCKGWTTTRQPFSQLPVRTRY